MRWEASGTVRDSCDEYARKRRRGEAGGAGFPGRSNRAEKPGHSVSIVVDLSLGPIIVRDKPLPWIHREKVQL